MEDYNFDEFDYATLTPDEIKEFFVDFCDDNELYVGGGEGSAIYFYTCLMGDIINRHPGSANAKATPPNIHAYDKTSPVAMRAYADHLDCYNRQTEGFQDMRVAMTITLSTLKKALLELIHEDAGLGDVPARYRDGVLEMTKLYHGDNYYEYYGFLCDLIKIFTRP